MIILEVVTLHKKPIGLVAAINKHQVGYSLYNPVKEKRSWDLGMATVIAVGRAEKVIDPLAKIGEVRDMLKEEGQQQIRPYLVLRALRKMIRKAKKMRW